MKNLGTPYRRIAARMALLGLSRADVARLLDISYSTLRHKLLDESPFTLDEALRLKRALCITTPLEVAFERCPQDDAPPDGRVRA